MIQESLERQAQQYMERFETSLAANSAYQLSETDTNDLLQLFSLSDFVAETLIAHPGWLKDCLDFTSADDYSNQLALQLEQVPNEIQLHKTIRHFRRKHMAQIAVTDLLNRQSIAQSLKRVSALADALIVQTYQWLYQWFCQKYATPMGENGPQHLMIIAMGKLGGQELNFSSDIDLIFAYPQKGELSYRNKSMEHQQFFTKLAQKLIAALHQTTLDGQVFRVDMRLRPFGDSGPLVASFAAMEDYYQEQGREWERYAMVKARILNPPGKDRQELETILKPFVFRRYIDYSVLESLRQMKQLIRQEVRRRKLQNNIKLGPGGIREIEFILQSIQLTRGGRESELQVKNVLTLLSRLQNKNVLSREDIVQLQEQYLFLRKVEHCLQQFNDEQTQELPIDEQQQLRLCQVMGFSHWSAFEVELQQRMNNVSLLFDAQIGDSPANNEDENAIWQDFWLLELSDEEVDNLIAENYQHENADDITRLLISIKSELKKKPIGVRGKESLDKLMPALITSCFEYSDKEQPLSVDLLNRVFAIIKAVLRRTAYLELLIENNGCLINLIRLCEQSQWIAEQLSRFPMLLDELLNPASLYTPTPPQDYPVMLRQELLRIPEEDLEQQMEALRQFKLSHQLRIAAADLYGSLPVMKVSDHLTWLAETLVSEVVTIAWRQMIEKYGYPEGSSDENNGFLVVGYGKLGGIELGYSSDLDLVFLHNCNSSANTSGSKPIASRQFYAKLAQRIMHIFNTKTWSGELYEIDLRLRPSGNSGLLVSHIESFREYLKNDAWTWEHQALVRSRAIAGHRQLQQQFEEIREQVLCIDRETQQLKQLVCEMRAKMRTHLDKSKDDLIDLKQGKGAMTDIEFLTQFWSLEHASAFPAVVKWSDNVRIISALCQEGILVEETANTLTEAYLNIRNLSHQKALKGLDNLISVEQLVNERAFVNRLWQDTFDDN